MCDFVCLHGKTALVTGAAGAIGMATAQSLAMQGADLILVDIHGKEKALQEIANNIQSNCYNENDMDVGSVDIICCDLSKEEEVKSLFNKAIEKVKENANYKKIDILVNNAGLFKSDDWNTGTNESYLHLAMKINFEAQFILCQDAVKHMAQNKYGRIVNVASIGAYSGGVKYACYCSSKSAILGLTKSLALEYAKSGITVNCVAPGVIDTPMLNILTPEEKEINKSMVPIGRLGTPQDIANAITFLCSNNAEYITGQTIHVNGGMVMY